jgi:Peptidase_C39 like family
MTHSRHLRERFRHARGPQLWQRVGKVPLMSVAALGAVTFATLPATQSLSATAHTDQSAVVDLAAAPGHTVLGATATPTKNADATAKAGEAAKPADATKADATKAETKKAGTKKAETEKAETKKAEPAAPAKLELYYQYGVQTTPWYCGPAATRMALSARGIYPSQDDLAGRLGTTVNGTNSSADIARVLNAMTKSSQYQATSVPSKSVTKQQVEKLRSDIVDAVRHGYPVVMNIAGSATDLGGATRSFPGGHYITVVGYGDNGTRAKIGDSANPLSPSYWIATSELAQWAGTRGYAA